MATIYVSGIAKVCVSCGVAKDASEYTRDGKAPDLLSAVCRACQRARRLARASNSPTPRRKRVALPQTITVKANGANYVADRDLLALWEAVRKIVADGGLPANLLFLGPPGSGKTVGAKYLAELAGLAFTKIDAAAMTDPEAWFGTREVIERDGVSVTVYVPSTFVTMIQQPGVVLVDEVNRIRDDHRNIFNPLLDGTRSVTNPLTGETVTRHPECYVIMTGNVGVQFTGTFAMDPALLTRSRTHLFSYMLPEDETRIVIERTGVDQESASLFVRFATETRSRALADEDFAPISTREIIDAADLVAHGLPVDNAARASVLNAASSDGGGQSQRAALELIWGMIRRPTKA